MSRNIKSLKTLAKHVGKAFSIVNSDGVRFFAVLEKLRDGSLCLRTPNPKAGEALGWWSSKRDSRTEKWKDQWCHLVTYEPHLTKELKSCSLIAGQMPEDTAKTKKDVHYATEEEVKEHVGYMCKLADGTIGKLVKQGKSKDNSPLLLLKEEAFDGSVGWALHIRKYKEEGWKYGWNMHDQGCETAKIVEFFKEGEEKAEEVKETPKKNGYLTKKEISKAIGKYCKLADCQTAFIAKSTGSGNPCICMNEKVKGCGWNLSCGDVVKEYKGTAAKFDYGWYVTDDDDAAHIKVVEILEDKTAESKKTLLDMTVRELLEKLNEIVER